MKRKLLNQIRKRRAARSRARVFGSAQKPRLSVFRSNQNIYAQLIDDAAARTLAQASSAELGKSQKINKTETAIRVGGLLAEKALKLGIKVAVLDRGRYKYHGRVRALAEGARKGGLKI